MADIKTKVKKTTNKIPGQQSGTPGVSNLTQTGLQIGGKPTASGTGLQIGGKPTVDGSGLQIGGKPTVNSSGTDTKIPGQISGTPGVSNLTQTGGIQIGGKPTAPGTGAAAPSGATGGATGAGNPTGNGLSGVSTGTQAQLDQYGNYQAGQGVSAAQQQLDAILGQKPGEYSSRYDEQLQGLLGDITSGRKPFEYSFNDDALFQYYSDLYQDQGRQAAADVAGQAAALTGGYGNSWGASAAQQAYQQNLDQLYDRGLEFRDRAYQQWQDENADRYNRLNALQNAENTEYGRYRDLYGDWTNERDYQTGRADLASNQDYERWLNDRNYWNTVAQQENQDYWTGMNYNQAADQFAQQMGYNYANMAQNQAQFDAQMAQNQAQFDAQMELNWANHNLDKTNTDRQTAITYVQAILANGQMPSAALLEAAGLSKADAQKLMAQIEQAAAGGGGGNNNTTDNNNRNMTLSEFLQNALNRGTAAQGNAIMALSNLAQQLQGNNRYTKPYTGGKG